MLGMAAQSVQRLVDRGEFEAWKTPGGHRRISRLSVGRWRPKRGIPPASPGRPSANKPTPRVLLTEDSAHDRSPVSRRLQQEFARLPHIGVASLGEEQRRPYAFTLTGVPLMHKPRLVTDLPPLLRQCLQWAPARAA